MTISPLNDSLEFLRSKSSSKPKIAVVLGSGLGDFADQVKSPVIVPTSTIPNYPVSTVQGHAGKIIFGVIENSGRKSAELVVFQGRVHLYESNDVQKVVHPIRVAAGLGADYLIVTNAAGGINRLFEAGTLMFIRDYINLTGENPLIGSDGINTIVHRRTGPAMDTALREQARTTALRHGIATKEGVYCWTKGPTYETASEIRMMATLGADAVGMSTVPEIIVAHQLGMKVLGISCITNMATGISDSKLSHDEVTETANRVRHDFTKLVSEIIFELA
jgi:purine-nucleoside phosphorylase